MRKITVSIALALLSAAASAQDTVVGSRVEVGPVPRADGGWSNFRVSANGGATLMEVAEDGTVRLRYGADIDFAASSFVPLGGPAKRQVGWIMVRVDGEFVLIPAFSPFAGEAKR